MSHGQRIKKGRRVLAVVIGVEFGNRERPKKLQSRDTSLLLFRGLLAQRTLQPKQFNFCQHRSTHPFTRCGSGSMVKTTDSRLWHSFLTPQRNPRRMNKTFLFPLFLCLSTSWAWVSRSGRAFSRLTNTRLFAVETISLESLENHEEEGTLMAESIVRWLDSEVSSLASNKIGAHYDAIVYWRSSVVSGCPKRFTFKWHNPRNLPMFLAENQVEMI